MDTSGDSRYDHNPEPATALVIDDEALIRRLIRRVLEPDICQVAEADSGEVGLRIIQCGIPPIDIVFTDIRMPGLTGWDVAEVLMHFRPEIPIGVISGYDGTTTVRRAGQLRARLLVKPFTANTLSEMAASLIADARAMQARARAQRERVAQMRETHAVRRQYADLRAKLDLVAAAWEVHRQPRGERA